MRQFVTLLMLFPIGLSFGQTRYEKDFMEFWNDVNNNYAYLDQQQIDWEKVKEIYLPGVKRVTSDAEFIRFMETVVNELHNGHVSLNTNLSTSNRIIPSGQDIFVQEQDGRFVITDLRTGFGAALSGLEIGDVIVRFNDKAIPEQVENFLPKYTAVHTPEMYQYALNMLFAGAHDKKRKITVNRNEKQLDFFPDDREVLKTTALVEFKTLNKTTAYIKINNALGNNNTIADFDKALDGYMEYKNLVIDLTETPGGGNSTVARCIMGRFINKAMPYQQHEFDEKAFQTQRKWIELVTPRKKQFKGKVYVIVGHWTGSMGEGMAIGFDGLKRATVIGTVMAKLLGAINGFAMSETNIGFQIPTERLYHINGTAREEYKPQILTQNIEETLKKMYEIK